MVGTAPYAITRFVRRICNADTIKPMTVETPAEQSERMRGRTSAAAAAAAGAVVGGVAVMTSVMLECVGCIHGRPDVVR